MATASMGTSPPAVVAVFGTAELFENILRHLPLKDLARSQVVCDEWQSTISASLPLQHQLFVTPENVTSLVKCNPSNNTWQILPGAVPTAGQKKVVKINPMIRDIATTSPEHALRNFFAIADFRPLLELLDGPETACATMFLSQPPCTKIKLRFEANWEVDAREVDGYGRVRYEKQSRSLQSPGKVHFSSYTRMVLADIEEDAIYIYRSHGICLGELVPEILRGLYRNRRASLPQGADVFEGVRLDIALVNAVADMSA
ncbi:hypothetical protein LTR09_009553 [Extremus antarcticus]|uniref:F-box domain-containing protein n=1 Tax=Extremus antarcticus TaxID=702011 RepID=A0AAJ0D8V1_9PEZI|nr:hypothetical protein LTR09_009553 [Extremus antarcticus]